MKVKVGVEKTKPNHGCGKCNNFNPSTDKCIKSLPSGGQAGTYCASYSDRQQGKQ